MSSRISIAILREAVILELNVAMHKVAQPIKGLVNRSFKKVSLYACLNKFGLARTTCV